MAYDPNSLTNYGTNSGAVQNPDGSYTYGNGTADTNSAWNYGTNSGAVQNPDGSYTYGRSYAPSNNAALLKKAPQQNSQGIWIDPTTGTPFHGTYKDPVSGVEHYYSNGKSVPTLADVGIQTPIFNETTTAKQPQINAAADTALATQTANAGNTAKSFADYLAQAKELNAQGAVQLKTDQAAVDPTSTVARVNADTAKTTADLNATNRNYATQQQGVQQQVSQENTDYAKQVQDRLDALAAENVNYEQRSQAVADQAFNAAKAGISLYQMGTGTPTSGSGDLSNRYIRSYDAINVPLQRELSANRTSLINTERQSDQMLYNNKLSELSGQAALNTDLANRDTDTTKYTGNLDRTTAQYIQSLMQSTAGMSRQMAAQYLQQLAVPFDVGQHILSGDIQNLAGIQSIYNGANWYTQSKDYTGQNVPATPAYAVQSPRSYAPAPQSAAPVAPTQGTGNNMGVQGNDSSYANVVPQRSYQPVAAGFQPLNDGTGLYQNPNGQIGGYDSNGNFVTS